MDLLDLYERMALARAFELALADLWQQGLISGEMHLGTGEEALMAGIAAHLDDGDAVAVDHRSTVLLTMRGVDLVAMLKEMLGRPDGLCRGRGGHMHLLSKERLAASSGIIGAAGPTAAGFALAAKRLRPGTVAVATFGDGAANQGMLLESWNLAVVWKLPVIFVCKHNDWALFTRSDQTTGGDLVDRAIAFGMEAESVDGGDAEAVYHVAADAVERARKGRGPSLILGRCPRLDGHFLGDPFLAAAKRPMSDGREVLGKVMSAAFTKSGGGLIARTRSLAHLTDLMRRVRGMRRQTKHDPLVRTRKALKPWSHEVDAIDRACEARVARAVEAAIREEAAA